MCAKPTYEELVEQLEKLKSEVEKAAKAKELLCDFEEALAEREALLQSLIESLPFQLFALGADGRYILDNAECRKAYGNNIVGKKPSELDIDSYTLDLWEKNNARCFAGETINEDVSFSVQGRMRHYNNILSPVIKDEEIIGVVGINIDIEEKLKMELERVLLEQSLWDVFNYMKFYAVVIDGGFRVKKANVHLSMSLGFDSVEKMLGTNWNDFVPEFQRDAHLLLMKKVRLGASDDLEVVSDIETMDGERISVRWFHTPANGDWIFSIGLPLLIPVQPTDTLESMRQLWAESLLRDRTMIKAFKDLAEDEWMQRKKDLENQN